MYISHVINYCATIFMLFFKGEFELGEETSIKFFTFLLASKYQPLLLLFIKLAKFLPSFM